MEEKMTPFELLIVLFLKKNHPDKRSLLEVSNFVQLLLGLMMDEREALRQLAEKQIVEEEHLPSGAYLYMLSKKGLEFPVPTNDILESRNWALANGAKEKIVTMFFESIKGQEA